MSHLRPRALRTVRQSQDLRQHLISRKREDGFAVRKQQLPKKCGKMQMEYVLNFRIFWKLVCRFVRWRRMEWWQRGNAEEQVIRVRVARRFRFIPFRHFLPDGVTGCNTRVSNWRKTFLQPSGKRRLSNKILGVRWWGELERKIEKRWEKTREVPWNIDQNRLTNGLHRIE